MYVKNKYISLIYKIILVVLCGIGLYLNIFNGNFDYMIEQLSYYTILSNLLCFIVFILIIIKMIKNFKNKEETENYPRLKEGTTIAITVTFLIFHLILRPDFLAHGNAPLELDSINNLLVHYIVPLMTIFDWILFDKKGNYSSKNLAKYALIPIIYLVFSCIKAAFGYTFSSGSKYPYYFLDIDKYGLLEVGRNVLIVAIAFLLLGEIFILIDKLILKISKKIKKN